MNMHVSILLDNCFMSVSSSSIYSCNNSVRSHLVALTHMCVICSCNNSSIYMNNNVYNGNSYNNSEKPALITKLNFYAGRI